MPTFMWWFLKISFNFLTFMPSSRTAAPSTRFHPSLYICNSWICVTICRKEGLQVQRDHATIRSAALKKKESWRWWLHCHPTVTKHSSNGPNYHPSSSLIKFRKASGNQQSEIVSFFFLWLVDQMFEWFNSCCSSELLDISSEPAWLWLYCKYCLLYFLSRSDVGDDGKG